jgi:hypothetical protein
MLHVRWLCWDGNDDKKKAVVDAFTNLPFSLHFALMNE